MADRWRFLLEDVISGQVILDSLDVAEGGSVEASLNRAGQVRVAVPQGSPHMPLLREAEGRVALYALRDDRIEVGGLIMDVAPDGETVKVTADGWLGYFDHRTIRVDRQFTGEEQFDIVETLIDDIQDEAEWGDGFDLGIVVDYDAVSGVTRDRLEEYRPWRAKNLGEALRQLASVTDGFDMEMRHEVSGGTVTKVLWLSYPQAGRDVGALFEADARGGNILPGYRASRSARGTAWVGAGWGDGSDEARLTSAYVDETKRGVLVPLEASPSFSGVTVQGTLDDHVAATFASSASTRQTITIPVDPDRDPRWGDVRLGDTVYVRIDDRFTQIGTDSAGPVAHRFVGWSFDVDEDLPTLTLEPT